MMGAYVHKFKVTRSLVSQWALTFKSDPTVNLFYETNEREEEEKKHTHIHRHIYDP